MAPFTRNETRLSRIKEQSFGVVRLPGNAARPRSDWKELDFENFPDLGPNLSRIRANVVKRSNQRGPGTPGSLGANLSYVAPLTMDMWLNWRNQLMYTTAHRSDLCDLVATGVTTSGGNQFTGLTAFTAAQVGTNRIPVDSLIDVSNAVNPANNGIFSVRTAVAAAATSIAVTETVVAETNSEIDIHFIGKRKQAATTATWAFTGSGKAGRGTLTWANHGLEAMGLIVGQEVFFGTKNATEDGIIRAMQSSGGSANDMYGSATVAEINAGSIVFYDVDPSLQQNAVAINTVLDVVFSEAQVIGNRDLGTALGGYVSESSTIEVEMNDGETGSASEFLYFGGVRANSLALTVNPNNYIEANLALVPETVYLRDEANRVSTQVGSESYTPAKYDRIINTSLDFDNFFIEGVDSSEDVYPDSVSMTFTTNTAGKPVVGSITNRYVRPGTRDATIESTIQFEDTSIYDTVIKNQDGRARLSGYNEDGAIIFKFNSIQISTGAIGGWEEDSPVLTLPVTGEANDRNDSGSLLIVSTFRTFLPVQDFGFSV